MRELTWLEENSELKGINIIAFLRNVNKTKQQNILRVRSTGANVPGGSRNVSLELVHIRKPNSGEKQKRKQT